MKLRPQLALTVNDLLELLGELEENATLVDLRKAIEGGLVEGALADEAAKQNDSIDPQRWQPIFPDQQLTYTGTGTADLEMKFNINPAATAQELADTINASTDNTSATVSIDGLSVTITAS